VLHFAVPAAVIIPLATWIPWHLGSRSTLAHPVLVVPACLTIGALTIALLPEAGTVLGERPEGSTAAIAIWYAGIVAIGMAARALAAQRRAWRAFAFSAVMAFALLEVAIAAYLTITFSRNDAPFHEAFLWYPVGLVGMDGTSKLAGMLLHDTLKTLPQTLTVLTLFTLAWQIASTRRPQSTPPLPLTEHDEQAEHSSRAT